MQNVPQVSERPAGRIPTTAVTNELARAIGLPTMRSGQQFPPTVTQGPQWVKIAATCPGDGTYKVILGIPKTDVAFDPDLDGAEFAFHDFDYLASGETFNAYFVNKAEENKSPHWLDPGGTYLCFVTDLGVANELPLLIGHTFDTQLCEEEPIP